MNTISIKHRRWNLFYNRHVEPWHPFLTTESASQMLLAKERCLVANTLWEIKDNVLWKRLGIIWISWFFSQSFSKNSNTHAFHRIYLLAIFRIFTSSTVSDARLRAWRTNNLKVKGIPIKRQELATWNQENLDCVGTNRQTLVVDPVSIQMFIVDLSEGQTLLSRCVSSKICFCSAYNRVCFPDASAAWFVLSIESTIDSLENSSVTLVFSFKTQSWGPWVR